MATMVVIKHGLRSEPMGGTSLSVGKGIINVAAIRQGIIYLFSQNVMRFNDGRYHATVNLFGFADLLDGLSEHDAEAAGFEVIMDNSTKKYLFAGLRWETSPKETDLKIFGPKSNPENPHVIDLLEG
jgi:hypothetical protein